MGRDDIHGNWRFVFLDACYSAAGTGWSNQFNIYSYSQSRAFLGWSDTVEGGNSTDFSSAFFPESNCGKSLTISEMLRYGAADQVQVIIQRRLSLLEIGHIEGSYRAKEVHKRAAPSETIWWRGPFMY